MFYRGHSCINLLGKIFVPLSFDPNRATQHPKIHPHKKKERTATNKQQQQQKKKNNKVMHFAKTHGTP